MPTDELDSLPSEEPSLAHMLNGERQGANPSGAHARMQSAFGAAQGAAPHSGDEELAQQRSNCAGSAAAEISEPSSEQGVKPAPSRATSRRADGGLSIMRMYSERFYGRATRSSDGA